MQFPLFFRAFAFFTLFAFTCQSVAFAADEKGVRPPRYGFGEDTSQSEMKAAEYVMRRFQGERLMPVRIMGGVNRPGIYYLPEGTDVITAISLSGGLMTTSDPSSVKWNQHATQKYRTLDLGDAIEKPKENNPILGNNDVLLVEERTPWISNNTLTLVTVVASILSVALSVKILREKN